MNAETAKLGTVNNSKTLVEGAVRAYLNTTSPEGVYTTTAATSKNLSSLFLQGDYATIIDKLNEDRDRAYGVKWMRSRE
jgi:hypothetical protein